MEVRYRREREKSYLVLETSAKESAEGSETYARRVLAENQIPGLLPFAVSSLDGQEVCAYEVSGKLSLQRALEKRPAAPEELRLLFFGMERSLQSLEEYLLDLEMVLLEPELVYVLPDFSQIFLCCCPGEHRDFFQSLQALSGYLLNKVDYQNTESVELVYEIFHITSGESFVFGDILQLWSRERRQELHREKAESPASAPVQKEQPILKPPLPKLGCEVSGEGVAKPSEPATQGQRQPPRWQRQPPRWQRQPPRWLQQPPPKPWKSAAVPAGVFLAVFVCYAVGGLGFLPGSAQLGVLLLAAALCLALGRGLWHWALKKSVAEAEPRELSLPGPPPSVETSLLAPIRLERPRRLISQNLLRQESIEIDHLPFVLGKQQGFCDALIPQAVISRIHARLEQGEGELCLVDMGSTNGTFQNGSRLAPHHPYGLRSGDEIMLANLKYIFD